MSQKPDTQLALILKHLESNPDEVEACLMMLEQGYCNPQKAKEAMQAAQEVSLIPGSSTMLKHLSNKALEQTLHYMHPEILTPPTLSKVKKHQGNKALLRLFLNLVQEDNNSPIPTHNMNQFKDIYKMQYEALGSRATQLTIVDGEILWHERGSFKLYKEEGSEQFTHIEHASGTKALSTQASTFNACFSQCHVQCNLGLTCFFMCEACDTSGRALRALQVCGLRGLEVREQLGAERCEARAHREQHDFRCQPCFQRAYGQHQVGPPFGDVIDDR